MIRKRNITTIKKKIRKLGSGFETGIMTCILTFNEQKVTHPESK